jgi:hypothetical protein
MGASNLRPAVRPISGSGKIGTLALGLLGGVNVSPILAILAPHPQQEVRVRGGAERCRPDSRSRPLRLIFRGMADLIAADKAILAELLRDTIAADRFPMSPRVKRLREILNKLDPPAPQREPMPPMKPPGEPSIVVARMRGTKRRR